MKIESRVNAEYINIAQDKHCHKKNALVSSIDVNETIYLYGNLPFFKIHVNHFMAWDDSDRKSVV